MTGEMIIESLSLTIIIIIIKIIVIIIIDSWLIAVVHIALVHLIQLNSYVSHSSLQWWVVGGVVGGK